MNRDYVVFYNGLRGLTNAEAVAEIKKKIDALAKERRDKHRATILEEQLKQLMNKTQDLEQQEMFKTMSSV